MQNKILEALSVTAELCGGDLSEAAGKIMLAELSRYPEHAVLEALARVYREHEGRLTLPAILKRIDDGRPGIEEAWAMIPKSEHETAVLTDEMLEAMNGSMELYHDGDRVAARMSFKEAYERIVKEHRSVGNPVTWRITLGMDKGGRAGPIAEAIAKGRIESADALNVLGHDERQELRVLTHQAEQMALSGPAATLVSNLAKSLTQRSKEPSA